MHLIRYNTPMFLQHIVLTLMRYGNKLCWRSYMYMVRTDKSLSLDTLAFTFSTKECTTPIQDSEYLSNNPVLLKHTFFDIIVSLHHIPFLPVSIYALKETPNCRGKANDISQRCGSQAYSKHARLFH